MKPMEEQMTLNIAQLQKDDIKKGKTIESRIKLGK